MNNTRRIKIFIGATMVASATAVGYASFLSHSLHLYFALAVVGLAAATSRMKVKLPGINGNMSMNLPFLLTAIVSLSATEAVAITWVSTVVQCWPRKVQRQRDGTCHLPRQPDVPRAVAFEIGMDCQSGVRPGNRNSIPRPDCSGRGHCGFERR